jgi:hypothetical protein
MKSGLRELKIEFLIIRNRSEVIELYKVYLGKSSQST